MRTTGDCSSATVLVEGGQPVTWAESDVNYEAGLGYIELSQSYPCCVVKPTAAEAAKYVLPAEVSPEGDAY